MYASYFGLRCQPFENRADPQFFFATSESEETLASLEYELRYGKGAALLLGEAGTGKTLLVRTMVARFDTADHVVVVTVPTNGAIDLLREVCKSFGVTLPSTAAGSRFLARLRRHLIRSGQSGHNSVLVIDQAEALQEEHLSLLASLVELQNDGSRLLSLLLVAQPSLKDALENDKLARFRQNLYGERTIAPLSVEETRSYIQHRLEVAGAIDSNLFDDGAVDTIHRASAGIPRLTNHLCDAAMLSAYGGGEKRVTQAVAAQVTKTETVSERTAPARDVGIKGVDALASGFTTDRFDGPAGKSIAERAAASEGPATEEPFLSEGPTWDGDGGHSGGPSGGFGGGPGGTGFDHGALPYAGTVQPSGVAIGVDHATQQLEMATLRAESAHTTMEASLEQHTVVEKHLTALTGRAERLVQGLSGVVQQATSCFDRIQVRLTDVLEGAEARVEVAQQQAVRVLDMSAEVAEQAARVTESCERADRVERRLTSFAEELLHKADRVHDGVAQLMVGVESSETARQSLQCVVDRASDIELRARSAFDEQRDKLIQEIDSHAREQLKIGAEELLHKADRVHEGVAQLMVGVESSETARQSLQSVVDRASDIELRARSAFDEQRDKLIQEIDSHAREQLNIGKDARAQLEQAQTGAAKVIREAEQAVRVVGGRLDDIRATKEEGLVEAAEALSRQFAERLGEDADGHARGLAQKAAAAGRELEKVIERAAPVGDQVRESMRQFDASLARATSDQTTVFEENLRQATQGAHAQLESLRVQASAMQDDIGAALAAGREKADEFVSTHARGLAQKAAAAGRELEKVIERAAPVGDQVRESMRQFDASLARATSDQTTVFEENLRQTTQGAHAQLESLRVQASAMQDDIGAALAAGREKADEFVSTHRVACEGLATELKERANELEHSLYDLESRGTSAQTAHKALAAAIVESTERISQFSEELQQSRELVDDLTSRADAVQGDLAENVRRGETFGATVNERIGQVEELQRSIASTFVELGGAAERLQTIRSETVRGEQVADRLGQACADAGRAEKKLDANIVSAKSTAEAIERISSVADERVSRLDSHHAAATQTLGQLSKATVTGHQLLAHVERDATALEKTAKESAAKIEDLTEDVWALTTKTETQAEILRKRHESASVVVKQLDALTKPGEILVSQLTRRIDVAGHRSKDLEAGCEKAAKLAERISTVSKTLEIAKDLATSVKQTVADAQAIQEGLSAGTEQAQETAAKLADLNATADGSVETQTQLQVESAKTSETIAGYIASAKETVEAGRRQLEDFTTRAREVTAKVEELECDVTQARQAVEASAAESRQVVEEGTAEARQIIEAGQNQAQQLEQVCAAVRKVFASLSKATLEAREETGTITKTCQAAGKQLASLAAQSDRAINHLQEWVKEAVRAQERLDATLQETPDIRDTHSSEALRIAMVDRTPEQTIVKKAAPATAATTPVGGNPSVTPPVAARGTSDGSTMSQATKAKPQGSKATEIAQLISNAKRAVAK